MGRGRGGGDASRLSGNARRRGPYKWTPERLEREVRRYTAGKTRMPTRRQFEADGQAALAEAVRRAGGVRMWAEMVGLELVSGQDRGRVTIEDLVTEARDLIAHYGQLPNAKRLRQQGHIKLATAVTKAGGAKAFVARHGLHEDR